MKALGLFFLAFTFTHCLAADTPTQKYVRKPEVMSVRIGGAFGQSYEIAYDRRELRYYEATSSFLIREAKAKIIRPSEEEWQAFYDDLERIKAWKWKRYYEQPEIQDGTVWSAVIVYASRAPHDVVSSGSNAYPPNFQDFLAAVQKLIGGKTFR